MSKHERVTCHECGLEGAANNMYKLEAFDTPWDDTPRIIYVHKRMPACYKNDHYLRYVESCADLLNDHGWDDFRYFDCPNCGRMICEQNPRNGWMTQYRFWPDDDGEQICLRCYEAEILENGLPRKMFEDGKLPGMFFSSSNCEPLEAGFQIDDRVNNTKAPPAEPICDIALEHFDKGHKVVIGYESMAIGGLESYVTLFWKES